MGAGEVLREQLLACHVTFHHLRAAEASEPLMMKTRMPPKDTFSPCHLAVTLVTICMMSRPSLGSRCEVCCFWLSFRVEAVDGVGQGPCAAAQHLVGTDGV